MRFYPSAKAGIAFETPQRNAARFRKSKDFANSSANYRYAFAKYYCLRIVASNYHFAVRNPVFSAPATKYVKQERGERGNGLCIIAVCPPVRRGRKWPYYAPPAYVIVLHARIGRGSGQCSAPTPCRLYGSADFPALHLPRPLLVSCLPLRRFWCFPPPCIVGGYFTHIRGLCVIHKAVPFSSFSDTANERGIAQIWTMPLNPLYFRSVVKGERATLARGHTRP